jgi:hypothetical protein
MFNSFLCPIIQISTSESFFIVPKTSIPPISTENQKPKSVLKFMRDKNGNIKTFSSRKGAQAFINLQKINK